MSLVVEGLDDGVSSAFWIQLMGRETVQPGLSFSGLLLKQMKNELVVDLRIRVVDVVYWMRKVIGAQTSQAGECPDPLLSCLGSGLRFA